MQNNTKLKKKTGKRKTEGTGKEGTKKSNRKTLSFKNQI